MDCDLKIISEERDCPDPLFDSIMNAMNSMKEATADKIYQKIQREGETNYSKPQRFEGNLTNNHLQYINFHIIVDRALANALKYGIFEVKNNRYRVRDDVLDDEDTVYWKIQEKKEQTPFRIEDNSDKYDGSKLNPETDNKRFRKISKSAECPRCGRVRKPSPVSNLRNTKYPESKKPRSNKKSKTKHKKRDSKKRKQSVTGGRSTKKIKANKEPAFEVHNFHLDLEENKSNTSPEGYVMREKEFDSATSFSNYDHDFNELKEDDSVKIQNDHHSSWNSSERDQPEGMIVEARSSSPSIKTESESDNSDDSADFRNNQFLEGLPSTSHNVQNKEVRNRNQFSPSVMCEKEYGRGQEIYSERKSNWMGCSEEPLGTIIQTNNVLTIEPMDSLAFVNTEHTSYIS